MNLGAAYAHLTVDQLKKMLDASHANHRQQLEETKAKWTAEVAALRREMSHAKVEEMDDGDGDAAASQRRFET